MKDYVMLFEQFRDSQLNESELLVYNVDDNAVVDFLKRYEEVEATMIPFLGGKLKAGYTKWLKWKEKNEDKLGGRAETTISPSFGTKTFYKFDWNKVQGWAEVFQYLYSKGVYESYEPLNEAKTVTYKRQYTEKHPALSAGQYGKVRDRILETLKDGQMTKEEFDNIVKEFNLSKRWLRNNASLFKTKGDIVTLSETGQRIYKAKSKVNETK